MNNKNLAVLWRMIEKECQRDSLLDLLEYWDLTLDDWYWLKDKINNIELEEMNNA